MVRLIFLAVLLAFSGCGVALAREPIGKAALENIAPLGGTRVQAERGLAGRDIEVIEVAAGHLLLFSNEVSVGICEGVYSVTRQLGSDPQDGLDAVLSISAIAGEPSVRNARAGSGAQGLSFYWEMIPEYAITIVRQGGRWAANEATFREGFC